ncbi:hypothetical protein M501DRAFT_995907 [Patellaria atrata CBS 101060]|uniref:Rhodopsin domain-containing protein n=1 Tax=Patellaria atrata CBS 101060 TaxID=1346257 RepID=A0A9P4S7F0_9PEZI|nr:hypothetical protein M501DRAFT_995907 [Patellaria atrata CBS 101060]
MRIKSERSWKWFLSFFIALNIINTITANTAILVQCRPTRILWGEGDPSTAKCWTPKQSQASAYVNSAVSILTDIVFALIPITFIRKMSTPLPSRLILGILLALGLLAGAAGIVKCTYIPSLGTSKDPFRDLIDLTLWNAVEEHVCVLAACLPTLKRPCEKLLGRWGLVTSRKGSNGNLGRVSYNSSGGRGGGYLRYGEGKSGGSKSGVEGSMVDPAGSEVAIITDGRGVGKVEGIRKTTEVRFSLEDVPMGDLESARPKSLGWEGREWEPV